MLVQKSMQKAAGEDGVLSLVESAKFAKDLGYEGAVLPNEHVVLRTIPGATHGTEKYFGTKVALCVGYKHTSGSGAFVGDWRTDSLRDVKEIPVSTLEKYLENKSL